MFCIKFCLPRCARRNKSSSGPLQPTSTSSPPQSGNTLETASSDKTAAQAFSCPKGLHESRSPSLFVKLGPRGYVTLQPRVHAALIPGVENNDDERQAIHTFTADWADDDEQEKGWEYVNDGGFGITWPLRRIRVDKNKNNNAGAAEEEEDMLDDEAIHEYDQNTVQDTSYSTVRILRRQGARQHGSHETRCSLQQNRFLPADKIRRSGLPHDLFTPSQANERTESPLHAESKLMLAGSFRGKLKREDFAAWAERIRGCDASLKVPAMRDSACQVDNLDERVVHEGTQTDVEQEERGTTSADEMQDVIPVKLRLRVRTTKKFVDLDGFSVDHVDEPALSSVQTCGKVPVRRRSKETLGNESRRRLPKRWRGAGVEQVDSEGGGKDRDDDWDKTITPAVLRANGLSALRDVLRAQQP